MIVDLDTTIVSASVRAGKIRVALRDGRDVAIPMRWSPRLAAATPAQRRNVVITADGQVLHWPEPEGRRPHFGAGSRSWPLVSQV